MSSSVEYNRDYQIRKNGGINFLEKLQSSNIKEAKQQYEKEIYSLFKGKASVNESKIRDSEIRSDSTKSEELICLQKFFSF